MLVEQQGVVGAHAAGQDLEAVGFQSGHVVAGHLEGGVDLTGLQSQAPGAGIGVEPEGDLGHLGLGPPVVGVALDNDALLGHVLHETERAGANRFLAQVRAGGGDAILRVDHLLGHPQVGHRGCEVQGELVDHLHRVRARLEGAAALHSGQPVEQADLDRHRVESLAVVELDALADLETPRVGRDERPALSQRWHHLVVRRDGGQRLDDVGVEGVLAQAGFGAAEDVLVLGEAHRQRGARVARSGFRRGGAPAVAGDRKHRNREYQGQICGAHAAQGGGIFHLRPFSHRAGAPASTGRY